ncbi:MAG: response regulator [Candidatus Kapaibacteriales bacterium]
MKKVLVVDDSIISRRMLKQMLTPFNFDIDEAKNGTEGLDKILSGHYDLIFLDLLMPDIEGTEILKQLAEKGIKHNVIVISADIQETTKAKCKEYGALAFLNKPPKNDELMKELKKIFPELQ